MSGRTQRASNLGPLSFLVVAAAVLVLGVLPTRSAQLPIPNPFGGGAHDAAVRAALSEFGKAVGVQLPIVVNPSDALPTADLPGPPFSPGHAVDIARILRDSADGTVELQPGDYRFTVDVFCMKV